MRRNLSDGLVRDPVIVHRGLRSPRSSASPCACAPRNWHGSTGATPARCLGRPRQIPRSRTIWHAVTGPAQAPAAPRPRRWLSQAHPTAGRDLWTARARTATRGPDSRTTEGVKHRKSPSESFHPKALALYEPGLRARWPGSTRYRQACRLAGRTYSPRSDARHGAWWTMYTSIRTVWSWLLALKSSSGRSLPGLWPGTMPSDRADLYIIYQIEQAFRRPGRSGHVGPPRDRDRRRGSCANVPLRLRERRATRCRTEWVDSPG